MMDTLKALIFTAFTTLVVMSSGGVVFAQDPACVAGGALEGTSYCANQSSGSATSNEVVGKDGVLNEVVSIITYIAAVASVIMVIIGGIMYSVSNGEPQKANRARDTIIYALVGLAVSMLARQVILYVLGRL